jgi:murein DD-endopeptidase MepM/ murein hydrolase activator NlpD
MEANDPKRLSSRAMRLGFSLAVAAALAGCNASGAPEGVEITTGTDGPAPAAQTADGAGGGGYAVGTDYRAVAGDTVGRVAERFNVSTGSLIAANGLKPPYRLAPGQRLAIPGARASVYDPDLAVTPPASSAPTVLDGSSSSGSGTAASPSWQNPATGGSIAIEELAPAAGGNATSKTASATTPTAQSDQSAPAANETDDVAIVPAPQPEAAVPQQAPSSEPEQTAAIPDATAADGRFAWPLLGKVVSRFGAKLGGQHNDGINIAAKAGTKVLAADGGVVAYAGNELRGFGNLLLVRHADGWITAYAHNEKLLVKKGDKVARGQPIALVGQTGNVDSPQLHFEIRRGSDPVDPLQHLAARG